MWAVFMRSDKARLLICWILALACAALGLIGGIALGARLVRDGQAGSLLLYGVNAGQQVFTFALPALLILQARPARWRRFREKCLPLRVETVSFSLLLAVSGAVAAGILASLWAQWLQSMTGYQGSADPLPVPRTAGEWAASVLVIAVVPALSEELLFRALIQGGLCSRLPRAGLWIAAAIFAAAHMRWEALPALLLVGAVLGKIYLRRGYWGSALVHALYNTVVLILAMRSVMLSPLTALICFAACILALFGLLKEDKNGETDSSGL